MVFQIHSLHYKFRTLMIVYLDWHFNSKLDEALDTPHKRLGRKVLSKELLAIPKRGRSSNVRKKVFTSHLMTSPKNQEKIRKSKEVSMEKEEKQAEKQNLIKNLIAEDKKKMKVTCRADIVKARSLPTMRRGGRGGGRGGRGRLGVRGHPNYKTDCKVDFCAENKELNWIKNDLFMRNQCYNII